MDRTKLREILTNNRPLIYKIVEIEDLNEKDISSRSAILRILLYFTVVILGGLLSAAIAMLIWTATYAYGLKGNEYTARQEFYNCELALIQKTNECKRIRK